MSQCNENAVQLFSSSIKYASCSAIVATMARFSPLARTFFSQIIRGSLFNELLCKSKMQMEWDLYNM